MTTTDAPTPSTINVRVLLAGAVILFAYTGLVAGIAAAGMYPEMKQLRERALRAEGDARSAYSKLYDQQERFGEEVEALQGKHSIELYTAMQRCGK